MNENHSPHDGLQSGPPVHQGNLNRNTRYLIPLKGLRLIIWFFFAVGIVGLAMPWTREFFIRMIPLTFVVCAVLLGITDQTGNRKLFWVSGMIFLSGWLVEVAGVNTGLLFGQYGYSLHMGPALFGTPLVMGLSWLMMIYLTVAVVQDITMHPFYRTVLAAVLMVVFDFLLEPAAIWMKMWFWEGGRVPVVNYMTWFLVSLALASLFPLFRIRIRNRLALNLFVAQMIFIAGLLVISLVENLIRG